MHSHPPVPYAAIKHHGVIGDRRTAAFKGPRQAMVRRSGILVHQLGYAPDGSHVAAVTTSVPERIGGDWNADYRLSWVRDTSFYSRKSSTFAPCVRSPRIETAIRTSRKPWSDE